MENNSIVQDLHLTRLNSTRAPLTKRRSDLIVRTPRGTPPVAGIPPGHISYVTDQMNRIVNPGQYKTSSENLLGTCRVPAGYRPKRPMLARLLNPAGASRGYIPDGHRRNWDLSFTSARGRKYYLFSPDPRWDDSLGIEPNYLS
ncbi:hypothetical protein Bbelb_152950 [Branchiostoma belcheri]|nr:hypothetical protein Bbelb_152950 [Branchiostoma belcheri]